MDRLPLTGLCAALLLGGCVAVPCADNPGMTCYAPAPVQPVAVAPAYAYPPGTAYVGPDGFAYVDGYPVGVVDGEQVTLVFDPVLGGWGYYDRFHRWRGAPPDMRDRLERFHPAGRGLPPAGNWRGGPGHPEGFGGAPERRSFTPGAPPSPGPVRPAAAPAPARRPPQQQRACPPDHPRC